MPLGAPPTSESPGLRRLACWHELPTALRDDLPVSLKLLLQLLVLLVLGTHLRHRDVEPPVREEPRERRIDLRGVGSMCQSCDSLLGST